MRSLTTTIVLFLAMTGASIIGWAVSPALPASPLAIGLAEEPTPTVTATAMPTATSLSTATATKAPTATAAPSPTPTDPPVVSRAIFVDQDAQMMHVYENGVEIKTIPCSTGKPIPYHWTPGWSGTVGHYVGTFCAFGAYADEAWYLFEGSGDILIHSAPYTIIDGEKVYQDMEMLGVSPTSHGCIRISPEDARWLTQWNPTGVPISIAPLTRKGAQ